MQGFDSAYQEACKMIGECYLMLAENEGGAGHEPRKKLLIRTVNKMMPYS
jgi:hypothetical protein